MHFEMSWKNTWNFHHTFSYFHSVFIALKHVEAFSCNGWWPRAAGGWRWWNKTLCNGKAWLETRLKKLRGKKGYKKWCWKGLQGQSWTALWSWQTDEDTRVWSSIMASSSRYLLPWRPKGDKADWVDPWESASETSEDSDLLSLCHVH